MSGEATSTTIHIGDSGAAASSAAKAEAAAGNVLVPPPPAAAAARSAPFVAFMSKTRAKGEWKRGIFCFDFLVRIFAIGGCLAATLLMGTNEETLPFFTQLFQFHARFDDLPAFTWFVVGNAIAGGYLLLSIPFSFISLVWPHAVGLRLLLIIFDTAMLALTCAAAASGAAVVYLLHNGIEKANWVGICLQFNNFCQKSSGAVVSSFVATVLFMVLVVMSALALRKH